MKAGKHHQWYVRIGLNFNVLSPPLFIFLRRSHEASHQLHISSNVMCDEFERPNRPSPLWARGQGSLLPHPPRGSPPRPLCSAGPAAAPSPPAEPQITEGAERAVGFSCHLLLHGGHLTSKQEEHKEPQQTAPSLLFRYETSYRFRNAFVSYMWRGAGGGGMFLSP